MTWFKINKKGINECIKYSLVTVLLTSIDSKQAQSKKMQTIDRHNRSQKLQNVPQACLKCYFNTTISKLKSMNPVLEKTIILILKVCWYFS